MRNFYNGDWSGVSGWGPAGMMGGFGLFGGMMFGGGMLLLIAWTLYWKYRALWHAAKNDEKWWFIGLLVINTLGILEILYLYFFSQKPLKHNLRHNEKNVPMVPPQQ